MYNKIIITGHLSKDIEMRYTQSGTAIANTAIASSRRFKGADGQQKEEVLFVDLTFFGRTAEIANQYLHKGSKVLIEGRLKLDQWTDQQGTKRSKHKVDVEQVQMIDNKEGNNHSGHSRNTHQKPQDPVAQPTTKPHQQSAPPLPDIGQTDEIPF
jgi:single-strand DNA-binding protein